MLEWLEESFEGIEQRERDSDNYILRTRHFSAL